MNELFPEDLFEKIQWAMAEGLTQSEIMLRQNCVRKWFFRYILGYKRKGAFSWSLLWGDVMHQLLEAHYKGTPRSNCPPFRFTDDVLLAPGQEEESLFWSGLAEVYIDRYIKYWNPIDNHFKIHKVEKEIELKYEGFRLRGKIDLLFSEDRPEHNVWLMDHKTTYDINQQLISGWQFRFQFLFYAWMYWRLTKKYPSGVYVNAIKKPLERRSKSKGESLPDFLARIKQNITLEPSKYFHRERLPFNHDTLARFEELTLKPIIWQYVIIKDYDPARDIANPQDHWAVDSLLRSMLISMNSDHCHMYNRPCEYLELCQNAFQDYSEEYIISPTKHDELQK